MGQVNAGKLLGRVIGETNHQKALFTAERPPRVGEYVLIEYGDDFVLGLVESSWIGNPIVDSRTLRPEFVDVAARFQVENHEYALGQARLLSWLNPLLEKGEVKAPRYPPRPTARVFEASDQVLRKVFVKEVSEGWIRLGTLANHPTVPFYVNIDDIVSRHLAILAVTGGGKSNTVAVLVDKVVNDLNGTVFIVDMHSEYGEIAGEGRTHLVEPKINPAKLHLREFYILLKLSEKATKQRMFLRQAYRKVRSSPEALRNPERFLENLMAELEGLEGRVKRDKESIEDLLQKLEDLKENYGGSVLTPSAPMRLDVVITPHKANIVQLSSVDDEVADVITYYYLNWLLRERKKWVGSGGGDGYPHPVLVVIEEAHILIPKKRSTLTKGIAARIAREGRKFGVGLVLVSQRPKNVDEDALSQTNNKIILKLVEPEDQRYVQRASETLSDELMQMLPSLNVGEAVVLGLMTPLPAIVKIDKSIRKTRGMDIKAHVEWASASDGDAGTQSDIYEDLGF